jgi:recombination protein RecA
MSRQRTSVRVWWGFENNTGVIHLVLNFFQPFFADPVFCHTPSVWWRCHYETPWLPNYPLMNEHPASTPQEREMQVMEREKALEMALGQIEKQFGKGSIMRMGENTTMKIDVVSTGALALDLALGIGGLPRGRITEIYGPESSGKSTLAMHVVAEAQRNGGTCAYIDAEHAMDPIYARAIGVDVDKLFISQPDTGEQALEICDMLVRSGAVDVVVIDSVAALTPKAEIEGEMGDTFVGLQARLMSQALRKLTGSINRTNTICIFINQLREKIGVMFGSPETTPGGRALKFYSSVRLDIRRIEAIKDGADVTGNRTRVKVVKNKVAPPFKQAEFDIMYGKGISREGSLLDVGVECGVVKKSGAWFTYEGEQLGQGREKAKDFLTNNPEMMMDITEKIKERVGIKPVDDLGALAELEDEPISLD